MNFKKLSLTSIILICLILSSYLGFVIYKQNDFKDDIEDFIKNKNQNNKFFQVEEGNQIKLSKNPFKKEIELQNLRLKIKDDLSFLELDYFFKIKEILFEKIIIKRSLNNKLIIKPIGKNEILYAPLIGKETKVFFELDADFEIKFKEDDHEDVQDFFDSIEFFEYKDKKIKIFNENNKIIFEANLSNHLEFEDKKNESSYNISLKKIQFFPFDVFINLNKSKKDNDLIDLKEFKIKIFDSEIDAKGEFYFDEENDKMILPIGEIQFSIKEHEKILGFMGVFVSSENINKIKKFIDEFSLSKNNKSLSFKYVRKNESSKPLINQKEISNEFLEILD